MEIVDTLKYSNPDEMWAELITAAIYIFIRTGKSLVTNMSPYKFWILIKPLIKHLRIVSSSCYFHISNRKRKKMEKKAMKGFLDGYNGKERYQIYVDIEKSVYILRGIFSKKKLRDCECRLSFPFDLMRQMIIKSPFKTDERDRLDN